MITSGWGPIVSYQFFGELYGMYSYRGIGKTLEKIFEIRRKDKRSLRDAGLAVWQSSKVVIEQ